MAVRSILRAVPGEDGKKRTTMSHPEGIAAAAAAASVPATAAVVEAGFPVRSVIPAQAAEVHTLNEFGADVAMRTKGEVTIEVLPAGAVVGVCETPDGVDKGQIEGGFAC